MSHTQRVNNPRIRIRAAATAAALAISLVLAGCSDGSSAAPDVGSTASAEQPVVNPASRSDQGAGDEEDADLDDTDSDADSVAAADDSADEPDDSADDMDLSFTKIDGLCDALNNLVDDDTKMKLISPGPDGLTAEFIDGLFDPIDPHIDDIHFANLGEKLRFLSDTVHAAEGGEIDPELLTEVLSAEATVSGYTAACD